MLGQELRPGLWRWTAYHEEWKKDVAACAVAGADELVLIDPLLAAPHWPALEYASNDRALHVLLTIHWHARSAAEIAARFPRARIWAHSGDRAATARRTPITNVYRAGEGLPGGLVPIAARPRSEVLFWEPRSRALIAGDVLLGDGERGDGLHTCPASWLPRSSSLADLRRSLLPMLELPVEMVLTSHGSPVLAGGAAELGRVAASSDR